MQLYRVSDYYAEQGQTPDIPTTHKATFDECRELARMTDKGLRGAVLVDLLDYPTDKPGYIAVLNGERQPKVLATWRGTARGGLQLVEDFREDRRPPSDGGAGHPHCDDWGTGEGRYHGRM